MVVEFTAATVVKIALEFMLGVCIKLFIENGRVHWRDFVNDFLFWLPMVSAQDGDGATRDYIARYGEVEAADPAKSTNEEARHKFAG